MKKLFSIISAMCIFVIMATSVYAVGYGEELQKASTKTYEQKFLDVPESHWAFSYISEMEIRGVISGYEDGTFRPDNYITRSEAAKMIAKIEGSYKENIYEKFDDVKENDWHAPYIYAVEKYFNNYSDEVGGKEVYFFAPDFVAEREDIVVALVKQCWGNFYDVENDDISLEFWDYYDISEKKRPYIEKAFNENIITGYSDATFRPHSGITRAEMACIMCKLYGQYNTKSIVLNELSCKFDCTLDEFAQKYNRNLEENFYRLKQVDSNAISPKAYKIDVSLLKAVDAKPYALENGAEDWQRDLFSTCKIYIDTTDNDMFVCNNGKLVGIEVRMPSRINSSNRERNSLDETKYVYICMVMSAFDISYEEGFALLCADVFNKNFTVFSNAGISVDRNLMIFDNYYLLGPYQGILSKKENQNLGSLDITIDRYLECYNEAIYQNFKHLTVDVRNIKPEDYIICADSLSAMEIPYEDTNVLNFNVFTYGTGDHIVFCDKQNRVLTASLHNNTSKIIKDINKLGIVDLQNIAIIMACDRSLSFDEAKEYYYVSVNGTPVSTNTCLINCNLNSFEVFSKEFNNKLWSDDLL